MIAWPARLVLLSAGRSVHFTTGVTDAGGLTRFVYIFVTLETLSRLVMLILLGSGIQQKRPLRIWAALGILFVESIWGFVTGSRLLIILPLAATAVMLGRVYFRVRLWHLVGVVLLFVVVVFPLLTAFRNSYSSGIGEFERDGFSQDLIIGSVATAFEHDSASTPGRSVSDVIAERMHGGSSLALIIRYTPERNPFLYGEPYGLLPLVLVVPRAIWPDKPLMAAWASDFKRDYWWLDRANKTAIAVTQMGDLWVNLHIFGVLLGSLPLGTGFRCLYNFLRMGSGAGAIYPLAVYATLVLPTIHQMKTTFDTLVAGTLKLLLVYVVVAGFLTARKTTSKSSAKKSA
ncbi:MAG: hypothetical protein ACI9MR_001557 [Myxococcota bacterium]|jgi:hypothetical protein